MSAILQATDLTKSFKLEAGLFASSGRRVWAVNGVSLTLERGETYGLVGESGSGKTTLARTLVLLYAPSSGSIDYYPVAATDSLTAAGAVSARSGSAMGEGWEPAPQATASREGERWRIARADPVLLREYRSQVRYIFQDPASSLDPRMSVYQILTTGMRYSPRSPGRAAIDERVEEVLDQVGLRPGDLTRRPGEFSGGQRQRISLARSLIHRPAMLICDEVVSALDVSIQGQILNLLIELKHRYHLTLLFIAHDLTVVSYMADRIGVMYGGLMMEEAPSRELVREPLHPYTKLLYDSIPSWEPRLGNRSVPLGTPYLATSEPVGCPFVGRCSLAQARCRTERPQMRELAPGHLVACHLVAPTR